MENLVCKQGFKKHNKPPHFILCKHASKTVEAAELCASAVLHLSSCCKMKWKENSDEKFHNCSNWHLLKSSCSSLHAFLFVRASTSSEFLLWQNVCVNAHLHLFEHECEAVCVCVCVCVCVPVCLCVSVLCTHHSGENPSATFPIPLNFSKNLSNPAEELQFSHSDIP